MPIAIKINPKDNVVVALHPIAKGTAVPVDNTTVTAVEDIPQGHKMAIAPIKAGENVIKYGFPIGHATADAVPGTWMHTHNVRPTCPARSSTATTPTCTPDPGCSRRPSWATAARTAVPPSATRSGSSPPSAASTTAPKPLCGTIRIWSPAPSTACTPSPIPSVLPDRP